MTLTFDRDAGAEGWSIAGNWALDSAAPWSGDQHMWFSLYPEVLDYAHAIESPDIDLGGCASATVQFELYFWNRYSADHDNVS